MLLDKVLHQVVAMAQPIVKKLETQVKAWTKPATDSLIGGTAADLMKSKEQLIMENALLRQQVIVLKRQVARPQLTAPDRSLVVVLASRVKDWTNALFIVKPETVLRWHREGFKLFWRRKSKGKARKPRISEATIALIKQMAVDNRRWGAKRIRGELLKLGIRVNKGTEAVNRTWEEPKVLRVSLLKKAESILDSKRGLGRASLAFRKHCIINSSAPLES